MTEREEQRDKLRLEPAAAGEQIVVRGGNDTVEKLRANARRTHRAWSLDGKPLFGVSVFCVLDDLGPASLPGILSGRLVTFRKVHVTRAETLVSAGFSMLATGGRPHYTVVLATDQDDELGRLLACLGPPKDNRYYFTSRRSPKGPRP